MTLPTYFPTKDWVGEDDPLGPPADPASATPIDDTALEELEARIKSAIDKLAKRAVYAEDYVVGNNTTDDYDALQTSINDAIAQHRVWIPAPTICRSSGPLAWNARECQIQGWGSRYSGGSAINFDDNTTAGTRGPNFHGFTVGNIGGGTGGNEQVHGYIHDLNLRCNRNYVPDENPATYYAGLKLESTALEVHRVKAQSGWHVGFDLYGNCYGSSFFGLFSTVGTNNLVGLRLRRGIHSGQDLYFYNCWLRGTNAAVWIEGNGAAYYFYGGQYGGGAIDTAGGQDPLTMNDRNTLGCVMIGKRLDTSDGGAATGAVRNVGFYGSNFEAVNRTWGVHLFNPVALLTMDNVHFLSQLTAGPPDERPIGILRQEAASTAHTLNFRSCLVDGNFRGVTSAAVVDGPQLVHMASQGNLDARFGATVGIIEDGTSGTAVVNNAAGADMGHKGMFERAGYAHHGRSRSGRRTFGLITEWVTSAGGPEAAYEGQAGSQLARTDTGLRYTKAQGTNADSVGWHVEGRRSDVQTIATDANFTINVYSTPEVTLHTGVLTADRTITLGTVSVVSGLKKRIVRTGGGAFNLIVGTTGRNLATNQWCEVMYDTTAAAWRVIGFGSL